MRTSDPLKGSRAGMRALTTSLLPPLFCSLLLPLTLTPLSLSPRLPLDITGKDATSDFEDIGHSNHARDMLAKYLIGSLAVRRRNTPTVLS
jgi:hypothetical protein